MYLGPYFSAYLLRHLANFLPFFWLQRFLPGKRQFHPLPGAGPKGCAHRLVAAVNTVNRLRPFFTSTLAEGPKDTMPGRGGRGERECMDPMGPKMAQVFLLIFS